uniref:Uncharacterized protein n=1 Tax=Rhizophora mucronata TaxID=61149 RepID=A0A2P2KUQ8_RHIMU
MIKAIPNAAAMIHTIAPAVFLGCCLRRTSTSPTDSASAGQGLAMAPPQRPSLPEKEDGCKLGNIEPDSGIGPVRKLYDTSKLSRVLQFSKLEGIAPVRKLWERSTAVIADSVEISGGIMPVSELRLKFK